MLLGSGNENVNNNKKKIRYEIIESVIKHFDQPKRLRIHFIRTTTRLQIEKKKTKFKKKKKKKE